MNTAIRMLLPLAFSAPMAVQAQITTLDYKGSVMHGTSTYLPTGFTSPTIPATLPSTPFNGFFTVSITVEGSIANSNLTLLSDSFAVMGNDVSNILLIPGPEPFLTRMVDQTSAAGLAASISRHRMGSSRVLRLISLLSRRTDL